MVAEALRLQDRAEIDGAPGVAQEHAEPHGGFPSVRCVRQESIRPWRARRSGRRRTCGRRCLLLRRHARVGAVIRSEEHTSELQSLMRISYAVFCLKKKKKNMTI